MGRHDQFVSRQAPNGPGKEGATIGIEEGASNTGARQVPASGQSEGNHDHVTVVALPQHERPCSTRCDQVINRKLRPIADEVVAPSMTTKGRMIDVAMWQAQPIYCTDKAR